MSGQVIFIDDEAAIRQAVQQWLELSGFSVFYRDQQGDIFHTFSAYGRGAEELLGTYVLLDMTPNGRNETGPRHNLTDWVRLHDRYDSDDRVAPSGRSEPAGCCHEQARR